MSLASILNETARISPNNSDLNKVRNSHIAQDPVLYKLTMTASNLHAGLSDLYSEKGLSAKANWHRDMSSRLKVDANHFI